MLSDLVEKLVELIFGFCVLWVVVVLTATYLWERPLLIPVAALVAYAAYLGCKRPNRPQTTYRNGA